MNKLKDNNSVPKQLQSLRVRNKKTLLRGGFLERGDEWIRTIDTRIFSPMLYQLSYITVAMGCKAI